MTDTVELVTRYYELLVKMRYLGPNSIAYAPHVGRKAINATLARAMGLDERVIETMEKMPYVEPQEGLGGWMGDRDIVFRDGRFVDYRKDRDIYMSRDPLGHWPIYNEKHTDKTFEEDMLDWEDLYPKSAFALTMVRGGMYATGDAIVIDVESNRAHIICTQGDGNHDPFFTPGWGYNELHKIPRGYKIRTAFYGPEIQWARVARDFLTDLILKTASLEGEFVPGTPYQSGGYDKELCPPRWFDWVRDLYSKYGWPVASEMREYLFSGNGTTHNPLESFLAQDFENEMQELKHNISVRYMADWYTPVPRDEEYILWLEEMQYINANQTAFARSKEEAIPLTLPDIDKPWGRMRFSKHWELYGKGNWDQGSENGLLNDHRPLDMQKTSA